MRDIKLFFKKIPEIQIKDPGESVAKVLAFRKKCIDGKDILFREFTDISEFEPMFRRLVEEIGWEATRLNAESTEAAGDPSQPLVGIYRKEAIVKTDSTLVDYVSADFLRELISRSGDWDVTSSVEVARFRLIASSLYRDGNDEIVVGSHDANLVYLGYPDEELSSQEVVKLLDTGVAGFSHQNVPLWRWVSLHEDGVRRVELLAVVGNSLELPNALRILKSLGLSTPVLHELSDRIATLKIWFSEEQSVENMSAICEFLKRYGEVEDAELLQSMLDAQSEDLKRRASGVIISIYARSRIDQSFGRLIEYDPENVDQQTVAELFRHPDTITTETLLKCLDLKADAVRIGAANVLLKRDALDDTSAERMITDTNFEVRLSAIKALALRGRKLDDEIVKEALIRPAARRGTGLLLLGSSRKDSSLYESYQLWDLERKPYNALKKLAASAGFYASNEIDALYRSYPKQEANNMRANLADGFSRHMNMHFAVLTERFGSESLSVTQAKGLQEFIRKKLVSNTLRTLSSLGNASDLTLIRSVIDDQSVDLDRNTVGYLGRFGDWSDVSRLLKFDTSWQYAIPILSGGEEADREAVARALYNVADGRLVELLGLELGAVVRMHLIRVFKQADIQSLGDPTLLQELDRPEDMVRKAMALKIVWALPKARTRKLLDVYVANDKARYYNTVHWLDLGASLDRAMSKQIAQRELQLLA
ncbi:hypothetical protein [Aurantimonas coralicida]|uniref:hypothetical protein n=1 Tax=Aurantimonas coralicida TaxID=182270 RepID=UPI001D193298|nr:hypothetical protein [Aurantimonas coralicida]MCC4298858.1 hypothetical protein [Aurantimonas coralicida]